MDDATSPDKITVVERAVERNIAKIDRAGRIFRGFLHKLKGFYEELRQEMVVGRILFDLLEGVDMLQVGRNDEEYAAVAYFSETGKRGHAVRAELVDALLALYKEEPSKRCANKHCEGGRRPPKFLHEFSRDSGNLDGRNRYCKVCERRRVKAYTQRKRLEASKAKGESPA